MEEGVAMIARDGAGWEREAIACPIDEPADRPTLALPCPKLERGINRREGKRGEREEGGKGQQIGSRKGKLR